MIYFRHPDIKIRSEAYGGIIQTNKSLIALTQEEYAFISTFKTAQESNPMIEMFLQINAICCIEDEEI